MTDIVAARWDVAVVGAGPAGSVAAYRLTRQGLKVLLVDRAAFPRWKVCGCCLNPATLSVLGRIGLDDLPRQCGAVPLRRMRLAIGPRQADIALPGWLALSRQRLDAALVSAGVAAGITFLSGTFATLGPAQADGRSVVLKQDTTEETRVTANVVLAADGLGSRLLAGETDSAIRTEAASRIGAGVVAGQAPDWYEAGTIFMAYGRAGYVGLVRLEDGRLNLAAAFNAGSLKRMREPGALAAGLLREAGWPAVPDLPDLPWRGTPALTRQAGRPAGERVLAIGDAAGYVEPFTGEGIGWALASGAAVADLAAEAARRWTPGIADRWVVQQRSTKTRRQRFCRAITWVSRRPALARTLIGVVQRLPWLAVPLVNWVGR